MYMYIQLSHFKVNDFVLLCIHCVASQTWTLGRLLPVMVGSRVPEDDSHWQFYLTTLTVVDFMYMSRDPSRRSCIFEGCP